MKVVTDAQQGFHVIVLKRECFASLVCACTHFTHTKTPARTHKRTFLMRFLSSVLLSQPLLSRSASLKTLLAKETASFAFMPKFSASVSNPQFLAFAVPACDALATCRNGDFGDRHHKMSYFPLMLFFFCSPCRASAASDLPFAGWIGCFLAMALTRLAKVCMGVCECVCMGVCVCVCTCEGFHFSLSLSLFDLLSCSAFNLRVYVFGADALQHLSWYGLAHARKLPKMTRYLARRIKVAAQRNQQTYDLSLSNSILFSTLCAPPPNLCFACLRFIVAITSPLPCTFTFSLCLKAT